MAGCATPGSWFSEIMSPTAKTSGWPGRLQSGRTATRPARSVPAPVAPASIMASGEARTPAARILHGDAVVAHPDRRGVQPHVDAHVLQPTPGVALQLRVECGQHRRARL